LLSRRLQGKGTWATKPIDGGFPVAAWNDDARTIPDWPLLKYSPGRREHEKYSLETVGNVERCVWLAPHCHAAYKNWVWAVLDIDVMPHHEFHVDSDSYFYPKRPVWLGSLGRVKLRDLPVGKDSDKPKKWCERRSYKNFMSAQVCCQYCFQDLQ
jgi:hypothetical protein